MVPPGHDAEPTLRGFSAGVRVFGRYTLAGILGRGGMGVVWRASDEVLGEDVALKFLPDAVRWDPGAYADLKAETRRARQLTHPNIVRIHDFVEDAGSAAISMELVDGATLTERRLAQPAGMLEPADILPWLPQLCAALDYAHTDGHTVHRDLKPSNLMLTRDGRLKVADFGVARSMADSVTRVSMMSAGTLVYMSPQQSMGERPSPADDIYALGATLYELLTGKPPFHTGDVRMQLFHRRPDSIADRRQDLSLSSGAVPAQWEHTVAACLAKEPSDRPASAGDILRRLTGPELPTRQRWRRPTRRELGLGALATTVAVAAIGAAFLARSPSDPAATTDTFPSDATRALAAWNFDGDARDSSGHGLDGDHPTALPTPDRFGRIDRAMRVNGNAWIAVSNKPALCWSGAEPFTAALWVRHDEAPSLTGAVCRSDSASVGRFEWSLGFSGGRPWGNLCAANSEINIALEAAQPVAPGSWHHLTLASDGTKVVLFVDGQEAATKPLGRLRDVSAPASVVLRFGRPVAVASWGLDGALDDVRLWRRVLSPAEVAALATGAAPPRTALTRARYDDNNDLDAAVREEFGPQARVLDWADLKRLHADDARGWADEMRLVINASSGMALCNGQRIFSDKRQYYISRLDGTKPDYFKVHDEFGGLTLALGSWHNTVMPVFALLPPAEIASEILKTDGTSASIQRPGGLGTDRSAVALSWRCRLSTTAGNAVAARLRLANGKAVQAVCDPRAEAMFALALGPAEGGGISRNIVGTFGEFDFTLVARDQQLSFRAVGIVGRRPLFHETIRLDNFGLAQVAGLEITGGAQSQLTSATLVLE